MNLMAREVSTFEERKKLHDRVAEDLRRHFWEAGISVSVHVNALMLPDRPAPQIDILISADSQTQMERRRRNAMKIHQASYECNIRWSYEPIPV